MKRITEFTKFDRWFFKLKNSIVELLIGRRFSSFLQIGDVVEFQPVSPYHPEQNVGDPKTYIIEYFRILPNSHAERPTEPVIVICLRTEDGRSSTECTIDRFKYIRHLNLSEKELKKRINR